jgi:hypothetical protein
MTRDFTITSAIAHGESFTVELDRDDSHHEIELSIEFHSEGEQLHIPGGADEARTWMRNRGHDAVVRACELAMLSPRGRFVAKTKAVAEAVEDMRGAAE